MRLDGSFELVIQFGQGGRLTEPTELGRCGRCARGQTENSAHKNV
jgi:hypothetical protein